MSQLGRPRGEDLLSLAAHQLKTPLAVIAGHAELMLSRATDETVRLAASDPNALVPVAVEEFGVSAADAGRLLEGLRDVWSVDGFPSRAALEFDFRNTQQELELPEPIQQEQVYDLSLLEELRSGR